MGILSSICKDNDIKLVAITDEIAKILKLDTSNRSGAGFAMQADGEKESVILYDSSDSMWTNVSIIAHELAHVLFGHLSATAISTETKEQEARIFAAVFTAFALWDKYRECEKSSPDSEGGITA